MTASPQFSQPHPAVPQTELAHGRLGFRGQKAHPPPLGVEGS